MLFQRHDTLPAYTADPCDDTRLGWSGTQPPPSIGADVQIQFSNMGKAKVVGYASHGNTLALLTVPHEPQAWWVERNGPPSEANPMLVFGSEIAHDESVSHARP